MVGTRSDQGSEEQPMSRLSGVVLALLGMPWTTTDGLQQEDDRKLDVREIITMATLCTEVYRFLLIQIGN